METCKDCGQPAPETTRDGRCVWCELVAARQEHRRAETTVRR